MSGQLPGRSEAAAARAPALCQAFFQMFFSSVICIVSLGCGRRMCYSPSDRSTFLSPHTRMCFPHLRSVVPSMPGLLRAIQTAASQYIQ